MKNKNKNDSGTKKGVAVNTKKSKLREKIEMYDMILANLYAGKSIIEPVQKLDNSQVAIGFSNISSETQISKYFSISSFPDYMQEKIIDVIRSKCIDNGVKINFYFYCNPYQINWESADMRNKMSIWSEYSKEHAGGVSVFNYRSEIADVKARERIIKSTLYLNEAEHEQKRSLVRASFIIEISARRTEEGITNMADSIRKLKDTCGASNIKIKELRVNMIDWIRAINPFSLNPNKETEAKIIKKIMTDDNLANFNSYKQGRVGDTGIPIGIDVKSNSVVLRLFKDDPDKAENWLISAETGGGKSMFVKSILAYAAAMGYTIVIMDYEGDEYTNFANYIRAANSDDVKVVSMGKGSAVYFDPCEIPELTGDPLVDMDLKESAISFILAIFRIITHGVKDDFTTEERKIMNIAIQRMYDSVGVTEDKYTWHRSKGLRLHDLFGEIKEIVNSKEFVDSDNGNVKHKAALTIYEASSIYFNEGEANAYMFRNAMSANELYKSQVIVFSFGMKGVSDSAIDPTILALKQLSVGYVNIQISNYCKYVKRTFNLKVWEEFQRWGQTEGSAEIISNVITGGRKRGDINFIITNDLASMLKSDNTLANRLADNIQNYAIGKIRNRSTREKFCAKFDLQECQDALDIIARASGKKGKEKSKVNSTRNKYNHSFCVVLDDGNRAIVKSMLPASILKSSLFRTGVQIK